MLIGAIAVGFALAGVFIWIWFSFFRTQVRAVRKCRKTVRTIRPGLIYLGMIPFLGYFFMFWSIWQIAETLRKEFGVRDLLEQMTGKINSALVFGYAMLMAPLLGEIPHVWHFPEIITLICIIIYWHKIASISAVLNGGNEFAVEPVGDESTIKVTE
jgi:hypothetical protein